MPAIKTYLVSQTNEIRISGVDPLEVIALARSIFRGESILSGTYIPNVILSSIIERELNIREES